MFYGDSELVIDGSLFGRWDEAQLVLAVNFFADFGEVGFEGVEGFETELAAAGVLGESLGDVLFGGVGDLCEEGEDVE